jgi:hypothetical protein
MGILEESGKPRAAPGDDAELSRIARRVLLSGARSLALFPAPAKIPVLPVAMALAERLAELTGQRVIIADAGGRAAVNAHNDEEPFAARWLAPDVALLGPLAPPATGEAVAVLRRLLEQAGDRCTVLVDLSGLSARSEQLAALRLVDAVAVIARVGSTREADLLEVSHDLEAQEQLGVLLTG